MNKLLIFNPDSIRFKNNYERKLFDDIKINQVKYFYLEDYAERKTQHKFFEARRELIKEGVMVTVHTNDIKVIGGLVGTPFCISKIEDIRKNKLINISYQGHKLPLQKKYPTKRDENIWNEIWIESFNDWVTEYLPKIKNYL
jgi:hypothetical protein